MGEWWADDLFMAMVPPKRGYGLILASKVQFGMDESGSDKRSGDFCVGSYAFTPTHLFVFNRLWDFVLAEYGLPYFHMTDCMCMKPRPRKNKTDLYKGWTGSEREGLARRLIAVIRSTASFGVAVSVNKQAYEAVLGRFAHKPQWRQMAGGIYTFSLIANCETAIAKKNKIEKLARARAVFYIESNEEHELEADTLMKIVRTDERLKQRLFYFHHDFVPKGTLRTVEAADMLAWLWRKKGVGEINDAGCIKFESLAKRLVRPGCSSAKHFRLDLYDESKITLRLAELALSPWGEHFFNQQRL